MESSRPRTAIKRRVNYVNLLATLLFQTESNDVTDIQVNHQHVQELRDFIAHW